MTFLEASRGFLDHLKALKGFLLDDSRCISWMFPLEVSRALYLHVFRLLVRLSAAGWFTS